MSPHYLQVYRATLTIHWINFQQFEPLAYPNPNFKLISKFSSTTLSIELTYGIFFPAALSRLMESSTRSSSMRLFHKSLSYLAGINKCHSCWHQYIPNYIQKNRSQNAWLRTDFNDSRFPRRHSKKSIHPHTFRPNLSYKRTSFLVPMAPNFFVACQTDIRHTLPKTLFPDFTTGDSLVTTWKV